MGTSAYVLLHEHLMYEERTDTKLIGIYPSRSTAMQAVGRATTLPGFAESPEGFNIHELPVGVAAWSEGFDGNGSGESTSRNVIDASGQLGGSVFIVHHEYEFPEEVDHVRMIGVFHSETDASRTVDFLRNKPGFRDHQDGFSIGFYKLGEDHWKEGFVTVDGHE